MQVVESEKKVTENVAPPQAEKAPEKSWTEQLTDNIDKAEKMATAIREKVLLPMFTLAKMAELMRISREDAQGRMLFIGKFGFVEEKKQGGIMFFRIVSDPKERIKNIEQAATNEAALHSTKMNYFEAMMEITTTYVAE